MDRHRRGSDPGDEHLLSADVARSMAERTGPPPGDRRFLSTDHLSTEAVAAYVDLRLPDAGMARADAHLARCPRCRREVADQSDARHALRGSGPIHMPEGLRDRLCSLGENPGPEQTPDDGPRQSGPWARLVRRLRGRDH